MVLDFSEDRNNPNSLSKTRLDLVRKIADENILQSTPANSKDSRPEKRSLRIRNFENIVLFDMTLEDLESNVANGCLLCDWLLQEHSGLNPGQKAKFVLTAKVTGDYLRFGTLRLIPGTANSNSKDAKDEKDRDIQLREFSQIRFQMLTLPGMFHAYSAKLRGLCDTRRAK